MGKSSGPVPASTQAHGAAIAPTFTRRQDRLQAVKPSAKPADAPQPERALTLSKSFDSYEATMRLAAMTGAEKDLERFSETQRLRASAKQGLPAAASQTTTWRQPEPANAAPVSAKGHSVVYVWVIGGVLIAAAAALVLLR
jgi:hypothetical protein